MMHEKSTFPALGTIKKKSLKSAFGFGVRTQKE